MPVAPASLAGKDNRGNLLVGEQLRLARGNEIRITSCGPDELSNEDERWAGGRGFSLLSGEGNGRTGRLFQDKVVTLGKIRAIPAKLDCDGSFDGAKGTQTKSGHHRAYRELL